MRKEFMARVWSRIVPIYLVNEHPGSGGNWLKRMLADALGLPAYPEDAPVARSCVMNAHFLTPPPRRSRCRTVALFRDGRDVMVSCYFKAFFLNEWNRSDRVRSRRDIFGFADFEDVRANLPTFMRRRFDRKRSWTNIVRAWAGRPGVVETRYEALRADTAGELARVAEALTGRPLAPERAARVAEAHTMARMQARAAANPKARQAPEISFYRSGRIGGWTDYFTDEALAWFEGRAGAELERLGYALGRPDDGEGTGDRKPTS